MHAADADEIDAAVAVARAAANMQEARRNEALRASNRAAVLRMAASAGTAAAAAADAAARPIVAAFNESDRRVPMPGSGGWVSAASAVLGADPVPSMTRSELRAETEVTLAYEAGSVFGKASRSASVATFISLVREARPFPCLSDSRPPFATGVDANRTGRRGAKRPPAEAGD